MTPKLIYGTAWKGVETEALVRSAVELQFRAIDTAAQPKHYDERAVGMVTKTATHDLWVQTKFALPSGQDERAPYDRSAPTALQVAQSFKSSLSNLGRIDAYLLHSPGGRKGVSPEARAAWRVFEGLKTAGRVTAIGVCNFSLEQLEDLVSIASTPPSIVQNRCMASTRWDLEVRQFCSNNGIQYQAFGVLKGQPSMRFFEDKRVSGYAQALSVSIPELVFGLLFSLGVQVVAGPQRPMHMAADVRSLDLKLDPKLTSELEELGDVLFPPNLIEKA